jgi:hypothetical protein
MVVCVCFGVGAGHKQVNNEIEENVNLIYCEIISLKGDRLGGLEIAQSVQLMYSKPCNQWRHTRTHTNRGSERALYLPMFK